MLYHRISCVKGKLMKKVILLNGAIRDTEEFILIIDSILYRLKKDSKNCDVEVIVSTWHEDIEQNRNLIDWMLDQGVKVIGTSGLDVGGPANVFRQWKTLDAGLSLLPQNSFVLKGRTDKFLLRKDIVDSFLNVDLESEKLKKIIAEDRLALEHISLSLPFMAKDMIYVGTVKAIRKTTHFSVRTQIVADHIFHGIGPECFLWLESCSTDPFVMNAIQRYDFRKISNELLSNNDVFNFEWETIDANVVELFRKWFNSFDNQFSFISEVLGCNSSPSWIIDEGSWRYQIGDRNEYDKLKLELEKSDREANILQKECINSVMFVGKSVANRPTIITPFEDQLDQIRNSSSAEYSDIVLLRRKLIESELKCKTPNNDLLSKALHWNIRQRDRGTIEKVYQWIMDDNQCLKYVPDQDRSFVIERMVDYFTFQNNQKAIEVTIKIANKYFKRNKNLNLRLAEYHFSKANKYSALFYFWKAYQNSPESLGSNHGLGCTLLDLGLTGMALRFLYKAHRIMPNDQTAAFTLIRALCKKSKFEEAKTLLPILSGPLLVEAERIINV